MTRARVASLLALLLAGCGGTVEGPAVARPGSASAPEPVAPEPPKPQPPPPPPGPPARAIPVPPAIQAILDAPDRTDADKALDKGRHPGELLAFAGLAPGMKVAELGAGGGYTTELIARAVGPKGKVFAQNSKFILERFAEKPWSERLKRPVMKNVVRVDREFSDPLPLEAKNLDAVVIVLFYHDTFWMKIDREAMNRAIRSALKPGGKYVIIDHSGRPGSGANDAQTLHRIEESVVREDVEKSGFKLDAGGDFLRNPTDPRDWNDAPGTAGERRGTSDRFALRFVKP